MPIYHHFYVESRTPSGWSIPPGFQPESWTFECDHAYGTFAWAHPLRGWLELFFGDHALFPFRPGPPDHQWDSPLLKHLDQDYNYDYEFNEMELCWIPYSDLIIDCWDTDLLTVSGTVLARHALHFGDGMQRFPRVALLEAGLPEREVADVAWYSTWANEPVDVVFGRHRWEIAELPPDRLVPVTWRATISEFIGDPHASLFNGLRSYGPDEDVRILSRRG